jgi:hypothetical protein
MSLYLNENNAFQIPVNNPEFLAEKILFVLNNEDSVKKVAEKGRLLVDNEFNYRLQCHRIKCFFEVVVGC